MPRLQASSSASARDASERVHGRARVSRRKADGTGFDGRAVAAALPLAPGVYRMFNAEDGVLYVGKARALRNRVGSYFNATPKPTRIMAMLAQVARIEVTVTRSEADALLLENQLIKSLAPREGQIGRASCRERV